MNTPTKPPKYTAEEVKQITGRILILRTRWLRAVETRLASKQSPLGLGIKADTEAADEVS
jgi:hypothetical protein